MRVTDCSSTKGSRAHKVECVTVPFFSFAIQWMKMHFPSSWSHLVKWCITSRRNTQVSQSTASCSFYSAGVFFFSFLKRYLAVIEWSGEKQTDFTIPWVFEQLMCTHLGDTSANCSISPHLGTCVLVKVLVHLRNSSVLGILPEPITQRSSITPMRLDVIIISIMLPQWAWFTSRDMAPAPRQWVNIRLFAILPSLFHPNAFNGERDPYLK